MRVCVLNEFLYPDTGSGTGKVVSQLARRLRDDHGFDVDALCGRNRYRSDHAKAAPETDWDGIRIRRADAPEWNRRATPLRLAGNAVLCQRLRRLMRREAYDALLVTTAPPLLPSVALSYKRRTGTPYAYIVYDLEPDRTVALGVAAATSIPARRLGRAQRSWLDGASKVVSIGRCMSDRLSSRYGVPDDKLAWIPVGYDDAEFGAKATMSFRARHGLEGPLIVYSGNFARYHEFETALDAAALLQSSGTPATFVFVGSGYRAGEIEAGIAARGLRNVRLLPFAPADEYRSMVQETDLGLVTLQPGVEGTCVPSKFYSLLAGACPTLALMAPHAEVARTISETGAGLTFPVGAAEPLAAAVRSLTADSLAAMRASARAAFEADYREAPLIARYAQMLRSL